MKVSKVAQLCKAERDITLVNVQEEGEKTMQWVGTIHAIYPLYGLRTMDKAQLFTIFDITDKQASKITFTETTADKIAYRLDTHDFTEKGIQPLHVSIAVGGSVYVPFDTSKGLRLVDRVYLMAMTKEVELLSYCERQMTDGKIYIVARMGMLIVGVVAPRFNAGGDADLLKFASLFADRMGYAWMIADAEKRARDCQENGEQLVLVNTETGELLEDSADGTEEGYRTEFHGVSQEGQASLKVTMLDCAEQTEQPDKIVVALREDDDGGDAA